MKKLKFLLIQCDIYRLFKDYFIIYEFLQELNQIKIHETICQVDCELVFIDYLLEILCFNDFLSDAIGSKEFFFYEYSSSLS